MTDKDAEFLKRLLVTFKLEATEHLKGISSGLIELEKGESSERQAELVESIYREAHSLKGAARAVNLGEVESICQALEEVFAALKKDAITRSAGLFDLLQEVLDFLGHLLPDSGSQRLPEDKALQRSLTLRLEGLVKAETAPEVPGKVRSVEKEPVEVGSPIPAFPSPPVQDDSPAQRLSDSPLPLPVVPDTVRVSIERLNSVLLQSEEMLSAKLASSQRVLDMRSASAAFGAWKKEWARVRPVLQEIRSAGSRGGARGQLCGVWDKHPSLARVMDFLDWNSDFIASLEAKFRVEVKAAERGSRALGGMINNLLDEMKKVLMFPFSSLLEILPKIVRDLSREKAKTIELLISGEEIEIDRRILDEMKDPLVHMVRNCIDHGIESPAVRRLKGKPECGTIRISVCPCDDKVELTVTDDGGGVALDGVRSALLKLGTLPGEMVAELGDQELLAHLFQSGVSTSPIITEISGRGLGLAIVREKVEKLGGKINVETAPDMGTTFRIVLPLTVATFRGLLVRVGDCLFVLPAMYVVRAFRVQRGEVKTVENRETICLDGEPVSLTRLATVLELSATQGGEEGSDLLQMVLLAASDTRIAFQVDEVVGEQEVLLKRLGRQLSRVRNVSGATVLGNSRVVPILNVTDLLTSAVKLSAFSSLHSHESQTSGSADRKRSVLVVEDSITTRTLLKNILEGAGYDVVTAMDGVDAITRLASGRFDIVVSDVDMPRMNGFDLTARIRADKTLGELPVVLVTALASREDREKGIDAGANAYIVKSSFDQSNLLEVIDRLV